MVRLLLTFVVLLYSVGGYAAERVKWEQGQEIGVELKVNVERKIIFPEKVRFAVKARYANQFKHSLIDNMMYITPVVYPLTQVPERYRNLYVLNPMVSIVETFRSAFLGVSSIEPKHILISLTITFVIFSEMAA